MLPHLLRQRDVALMPFALNDATRFISPTKTLEYLAAGLDVVSTAVPDVVSLYGHLVHVAHGCMGFEQAIGRLLDGPRSGREHADRVRQQLLDASTWDATVARIFSEIKPWLGESVESMPDLRLDTIGLDEPSPATARRPRSAAH